MPRLNQIIAVETGTKTEVMRELTDAHQVLQKEALMKGLTRTYQPVDDEGEQYPPESTSIQINASDVIDEVRKSLVRLLDVTATKDWGNNVAKANIVIDDKVIAKDVPVTYLLFLEKKLTDLNTFVNKLPVLDPTEQWVFDESKNVWVTTPIKTTKTKKVPRNHVKAEATPEHPAQVEVYYEDVVVGHWQTVKHSSALQAKDIAKMRERVKKLLTAVKFAREEANSATIDHIEIGEDLLSYIFD